MNLNALHGFVAVAKAQSFTEAARRLGVPKSTLSRTVRQLEQRMGRRLLHRTTRRVTVTPAGRSLMEQAAPHLEALASIGSASEALETGGSLRLTATPDIGLAFLAPAIARFSARYPGVGVETVLSAEVIDVIDDELDVALRVTRGRLPDLPNVVARRLGGIELCWYASPRYLARAGVPQDESALAEHVLVGLSQAPYPADLKPSLTGADTAFLQEVVRCGGGIGLLPTLVAASSLRIGELVRVLDVASWTGNLWLLTPEHERRPAPLQAFVDVLIDVVEQTPGFHGSSTSNL